MIRWLAYAIIALVTLYTLNYARWAWQRHMYRGAVGLALLGALAAATPMYIMTLRR